MKIFETLKKRSENPSDGVKIELKLYNLADDLTKKAVAHLKRITRILPEFDLHDKVHSEKVLYNQEQLLGDRKIQELSVYELFLIHLSAFFHDCAMAPSDWEIEVLKLTEGTDKFKVKSDSLLNDLKAPLKLSEAIKVISSTKGKIYGTFESDVKEWIFSPSSEKELINYLADLLVDYQNYRNGFADQIRRIESLNDFEKLNDFIRIDYIRATHHTRIETYVKNLESLFSNAFEQPTWGKQLANDLAKICRSHGEDSTFVNKLSANAQYYGNESANLQFVAIMLRLGDIIHFSFDRAPIDLRSSRIFKSEYSFLQWAVKNNGVNYSIENGLVSFRAYCEDPESYFKLHQYIDWIEIEIQNYFKFERLWNKIYIDNFQDKVDRTNVNNDEDVFLPKRGLSFSLNQTRTIELLMGVGLYKDKFACLRELYQNSLDACRCMISQNRTLGKSTRGIIEFGLQSEEGKTFLYCLDNGIGMSKHIIETYLLNIGNSYYKSSDFFKYQAKWGGDFTPISQFGIGILSCFMIGNKIEITTKTIDGNYISCSIDGPHENFYYKKTNDIEKEKILESGTIVRVQLVEEISQLLNVKKLNKLGILLLGKPKHVPEEYVKYLDLYNYWNNHLYNKVNGFVGVIQKDIDVLVNIEDDTKLKIESKPIIIEEDKYGVCSQDLEYIHFLNNSRRIYQLKYAFTEIKDLLELYEIDIIHKSVQYKTTFALPKSGLAGYDSNIFYSIPKVDGRGVCIDGIVISNSNPVSISHYYTNALSHDGVLNFKGENRPQLSVDRTSIINYDNEHEEVVSELVLFLLKEMISITQKHISDYKIEVNSKEFNLIWDFIFEKIGYADTLFVNELSYTEYGNILWKGVVNSTRENITIKQFVEREEVSLRNYNLSSLDILTQKLIIFKLLIAEEIIVSDNSLVLRSGSPYKIPILQRRQHFNEKSLIVRANKFGDTFDDYDLISNLYPIVPEYLFDKIDGIDSEKVQNSDAKLIYSFSNGITAFFNQDPFLINEKLGLYITEKNSFGKDKNSIYEFQNKRAKIHLFEINKPIDSGEEKKRMVISVFISPKELSLEESSRLDEIRESDYSYYKGVKEGWSILVTGMDKYNTVIIPGKCTRKEMIAHIPEKFWQEYKDYVFVFPNNSTMER
ncbi:ATP-binding protein [Prolixibacter sp. NT017]|uniref:HD domain-containing protein n=1 Tax=Prolixibacter sp. NT017 TaxID=2652390 RepID=UPI00127C9038|nr:ATP-binding protein [Prolixibacter sp. NT017]GET25992.1 hypothetical protein NT017_23210 [Prolixibacter sp. NT017]